MEFRPTAPTVVLRAKKTMQIASRRPAAAHSSHRFAWDEMWARFAQYRGKAQKAHALSLTGIESVRPLCVQEVFRTFCVHD